MTSYKKFKKNVFVLFVDKVQAGTQATVNGGLGAKSDIVVAATLDGQPSAPTSLRRMARNESCLSLAWNPPVITNGHITQYKVMTVIHWAGCMLAVPLEWHRDVQVL